MLGEKFAAILVSLDVFFVSELGAVVQDRQTDGQDP